MGSNLPTDQARRRDKWTGLAILAVAFAACMALSLWGMEKSTPKPAPEPDPPSEVGLKGFPDKVDPFELLPRAREKTVRSRFRGFVAGAVNSDGLMDFGEENNFIRYAFRSPEGLGPQPERKGGTLPVRRFCGQQSVFVQDEGIFADDDMPGRICPKDEPEDLPAKPHCTLKDLWAVAKTQKISDKGTARVEYFEATGGPAFRFRKDRKSFVVLDSNCKKVVKGVESHGDVP